jgi:hypothetical protein
MAVVLSLIRNPQTIGKPGGLIGLRWSGPRSGVRIRLGFSQAS